MAIRRIRYGPQQRRAPSLARLLGLGGTGLPRKLRKPGTAKRWGERFSERWGNEYGELFRRYRTLSRGGGLPTITDYYVRRKIVLGSEISSPRGRKWKESTKTAFGEIKGVRKDTLYTMAMLPFQVLKHEDNLERLLEEAAKIPKNLNVSFTDPAAKRRAADRYMHILSRMQGGKKRLGEYSDKLKIFRAALLEIEAESPTVWGKRISPRVVLGDLDKIEKHVAEAQERFELASKDIGVKSRTVGDSSSWVKRWGR